MQARVEIAAGLCLFVSLVASPVISVRSAIAADSPPEVVRKLTDAVIAVLKQKDLSADARLATIRDIVYDYADFATISRLVLARNWNALDTIQKERFVATAGTSGRIATRKCRSWVTVTRGAATGPCKPGTCAHRVEVTF